MLPPETFDKIVVIVKVFLITVLLAGLAAAVEYTNTVDWTGLGVFGPTLGLAVGTGLAALVGYVKKEFTGYGTKENPQIPGDG